jgi:hypothetical protein
MSRIALLGVHCFARCYRGPSSAWRPLDVANSCRSSWRQAMKL